MACLRLGLKDALTSRTVGEGESCQPLLDLYFNERSDLNTAFLHVGYGLADASLAISAKQTPRGKDTPHPHRREKTAFSGQTPFR